MERVSINCINSIQLIRFFTNIGNHNRFEKNKTGLSKLGEECYDRILQYLTDSH